MFHNEDNDDDFQRTERTVYKFKTKALVFGILAGAVAYSLIPSNSSQQQTASIATTNLIGDAEMDAPSESALRL